MKYFGFKISALFFIFTLFFNITALAQGEEEPAKAEGLSASDNVTLDFKDADILNVLKIISYKAGVNIVAAPEVSGNITVRLTDVPWQTALDVILRTNGLVFEREGNIITVAPIAKITEQKKQEVELAQVQPTVTEVFNLKYIDAQDAKKALESQLSPRGKITILEMTGQSGWEFGGKELGKRRKEEKEKLARSKVLIISDIFPALERIRKVITQIDVQPRQVLIETKIIEVSKDKLRDIGFDWGTGIDGATSTTISAQTMTKNLAGDPLEKAGGNILGSQVKPSIFSPKATAISGVYPYNLGMSLLFQKLSGIRFEALIHALEEEVGVNTLSAPRILALNNQEATILVGTRYPILKQDTVATTGSPVVNLTLDYYQDIGIQLNVIPQIGANDSINMVVHPAVTSYTNTLGTAVQYPILEIREAETRILMNDGETVVIGGLLKDVKNKSVSGIPFLKDLPYLGKIFGRDTVDTEKIDLIIFITAHIVKEGSLTLQELKEIETRLGRDRTQEEAIINAGE
ncbi:MAG: type IV pilus secretin PilQ [Candidatus Omnitrophota bacterium]